MKPRIIAFYLPQYYPTPLNNKWYGEGFTEWTNVGKARKLFHGHYQPRVPADLGYYDLRNSEIQEKQAALAKYAGIEGFCYYHYWFGNGHVELDVPLKNLLNSGSPNYPFCLCWANQSWYSKFWNCDNKCEAKLIAEQKYDDEKWRENHFLYLLKAFKDPRYIKVNQKLLFMIYRPLEYDEVKTFMSHWQQLAFKHDLPGFYFIGQATSDIDAKKILDLGFDGVNISRKDDFLKSYRYTNPISKYINKAIRAIGGAPYHYDYKHIVHTFIQQNGIEQHDNIFPTLLPNWDHSPRSGKRGIIFHNSTPELFKKNILDALNVTKDKSEDMRIIFLKSWNEWGEGNYIEPDLKFGKGYINIMNNILNH